MIIFNTTFHVHSESIKPFLVWIRGTYVPKAVESNLITHPKLMLIMAGEEGSLDRNYSLQFQVENEDILEKWYKETGVMLLNEMKIKFDQKVAGFSTLMKVLEI